MLGYNVIPSRNQPYIATGGMRKIKKIRHLSKVIMIFLPNI